MTTTNTITTTLLDIGGGAKLEVAMGPIGPDLHLLAAHPADAFGTMTVQLLAAAAQVPAVCVNPRGVGNSSRAVQSLEQMADDLEDVRLRLGLGKLVFWGMSGGGWLALTYARRHPHALKGLVLESVCACFRARLADPECLLSPFHPSWREMLASLGLVAASSHEGALERTEWIEVARVGAVFRRSEGPALLVSPFALTERFKGIMPVLMAFDARSWLGTLTVPALVIAGREDPIVPVPHVRALADGLRAEFVIVEGAGHVPTTEQRPEVLESVRRFLKGLRAA